MPGPIPKPPGLRQRRNRVSTKATLPTEAEAAKQEIPPLPPRKGKWRPEVIFWWEVTWKSPMATEYLEADKPGLYILATLHQAFWTASNKDKFRYAPEIRQQSQKYGLTPIDRRGLQWEVERGDVASQRTQTRRKRKRPDPKEDPREVLKLEK